MSLLRRPLLTALSCALGLLVLAEALLWLAGLSSRPVVLDVGPSTGQYLTGFTESEERPPLSFRWTRREARVRLPLLAVGEGRLRLRCARFLDEPVTLQVGAGGAPLGSLVARPGGFKIHELPVRVFGGPLEIALSTAEGPDADLGVALDWLRLEGLRFRIPLRAPGPRLLVIGVFVLALAAGFRAASGFALGAAMAVAVAAWAAWDPLATAHVTSKLALPGLVLTALTLLLLRKRPLGKWVMLVFLAGYLVKGGGLFHPSAFYPDVRTWSRLAMDFARAEGTLAERSREAQVRNHHLRYLRGHAYTPPYSPAFLIPFAWLPQQRAGLEEAMKQVALAAAAAEVVLVFLLASLILGEGSGLVAAILAAFLPPLLSRLLLAMYPTIVGHLLDLAVVVAAVGVAGRPASRGRLGLLGLATFASLFTYVTSIFSTTGFVWLWALLERRLAWRVLSVLCLAVLLTVALLYLPFGFVFVRELLPLLLAGGPSTAGLGEGGGLLAALARIPLFYGYLYPALSVGGLIVIGRHASPAAARVVYAYGLAFLGLVALRAFGGDPFRDLKEITFVGPFVALTAGASLETLAARGRTGRWTAWLVILSLVGFGLWRYHAYFEPVSRLIGLP